MLKSLIYWSIHNRFLVLIATLILTAWGWVAVQNTPLDAIPDLSDVQVIIKTNYPGQSPRTVEDQVTYSHYHHHAVRAGRAGGAWLFVFWRLLCLCDF